PALVTLGSAAWRGSGERRGIQRAVAGGPANDGGRRTGTGPPPCLGGQPRDPPGPRGTGRLALTTRGATAQTRPVTRFDWVVSALRFALRGLLLRLSSAHRSGQLLAAGLPCDSPTGDVHRTGRPAVAVGRVRGCVPGATCRRKVEAARFV